MQRSILGSRYRLVEYIAKSVFSETYLAEDIQLPGKDKCVVKQLDTNVNDPNFIKVARHLLKSKTELLNTLEQQNQIPQLLTYFEEDKKLYLVQQYIKGQTFTNQSTPGQPWSESDVVELLQDCINISNFIQTKKVINRDLKSRKLNRRQSNRKMILADLDTLKEVIPALAGLEYILQDIPQTETDRDTSTAQSSTSQSAQRYELSQDTSISPANRANSYL